jgi:hypothetical protein
MSMITKLQSRKLGLVDLFAMGFELYLKNFKAFLTIFGATLFPYTLILSFIQLYNNPPSLLPVLLNSICTLAILPIYTIALAITVDACVAEGNPQFDTVLRRVTSGFLPVFSSNIKYQIIFFLRFLCLIIPGVIYLINNNYFAFAIILRGQRGRAAFQYSRSLVRGNWWKVFVLNVLAGIAAFGLQILVKKILSPLMSNSPVLVNIFSDTLSGLVALGIGISAVLLFLNLDFRNGELQDKRNTQHQVGSAKP